MTPQIVARNARGHPTSEQHQGKHAQVEPAHHLTSPPPHGHGAWPRRVHSLAGTGVHRHRERLGYLETKKLPSGEGARDGHHHLSSVLMHHDRSECERTVPGISENYSCWLHNSPHTAVSPQGVAAWGSSVSVTALIHRPSSPSSSAGLNETGLRTASRLMAIISPSWAWAQALAQLEWHHHLPA